jgi:hypothetical protein
MTKKKKKHECTMCQFLKKELVLGLKREKELTDRYMSICREVNRLLKVPNGKLTKSKIP